MLKELAKLIWTRTSEHVVIDNIEGLMQNLINAGSLKRFFAMLLAIVELSLSLVFNGIPITPYGEALDLTGYEMVFCDEFEGDTLNTDVWFYRANGARRNGFNAPSQVTLRDGNLVLTGEYLEDGEYGEGWYAGMIGLTQKYTRGYFEIKAICNEGGGYWSAFWLQADAPYTPEISKGGIGGAEIDIMESLGYDNLLNNGILQTVHCSGMDGDTSGKLNSLSLGYFKGNNIYKEYNTYGLKWTEDEYIFYINGVETARTSWADGVSQVPEQVIVSLEIPGELHKDMQDLNYKTEYIVDYVKIYQEK